MKIRSSSSGATRKRARTILAVGLGVGGLAQTASAAPPPPPTPTPTTFQTLNFPGGNSTFLTGIRGDNIVGNYTIPGTNETGGLYYNMTTQTWLPMPQATSNGANFPGAIGSSPYGPGFGNPRGILRVVGSYQTTASAPYDLSYLYDGAAAPGKTLTTLVYPEAGVLYTIAHSTFGNKVVGDYDTDLTQGKAFIYNIDNKTYTPLVISNASTTAYGIYGDKIAGGYAEVLPGGGLGASTATSTTRPPIPTGPTTTRWRSPPISRASPAPAAAASTMSSPTGSAPTAWCTRR